MQTINLQPISQPLLVEPVASPTSLPFTDEKKMARYAYFKSISSRWTSFGKKPKIDDEHCTPCRQTDIDFQYNIDRYSRYFWSHYNTELYQEKLSKGEKIYGTKSPSKYAEFPDESILRKARSNSPRKDDKNASQNEELNDAMKNVNFYTPRTHVKGHRIKDELLKTPSTLAHSSARWNRSPGGTTDRRRSRVERQQGKEKKEKQVKHEDNALKQIKIEDNSIVNQSEDLINDTKAKIRRSRRERLKKDAAIISRKLEIARAASKSKGSRNNSKSPNKKENQINDENQILRQQENLNRFIENQIKQYQSLAQPYSTNSPVKKQRHTSPLKHTHGSPIKMRLNESPVKKSVKKSSAEPTSVSKNFPYVPTLSDIPNIQNTSDLNKAFFQEKSDRTLPDKSDRTITPEENILATAEKDSFYDSIRKNSYLNELSNLTDALDKSETHLTPKEDLKEQDSFRWDASGVIERKPFEFKLPTNESRSYYDTEFDIESTKKDMTVTDIEEREREPPKPSPKDLRINLDKLHSAQKDDYLDTLPSKDVEDEFEYMTKKSLMKLNSLCESDNTSRGLQFLDGSKSRESREAPESFRDFKEYYSEPVIPKKEEKGTPEKRRATSRIEPKSPQKTPKTIDKTPVSKAPKPRLTSESKKGLSTVKKNLDNMLKSNKKSSVKKNTSASRSINSSSEEKSKKSMPSFGEVNTSKTERPKSERPKSDSRKSVEKIPGVTLSERTKDEILRKSLKMSEDELLLLMQTENKVQKKLDEKSEKSSRISDEVDRRAEYYKRRQESFGAPDFDIKLVESEILIRENVFKEPSSTSGTRKGTFTREDAIEIGQLSGKIIARMESMEKGKNELGMQQKKPAVDLFKKKENLGSGKRFDLNRIRYLRDMEDEAARIIQGRYKDYKKTKPSIKKEIRADERNEFKELIEHFKKYEDLYLQLKKSFESKDANDHTIELALAFMSAYSCLKK